MGSKRKKKDAAATFAAPVPAAAGETLQAELARQKLLVEVLKKGMLLKDEELLRLKMELDVKSLQILRADAAARVASSQAGACGNAEEPPRAESPKSLYARYVQAVLSPHRPERSGASPRLTPASPEGNVGSVARPDAQAQLPSPPAIAREKANSHEVLCGESSSKCELEGEHDHQNGNPESTIEDLKLDRGSKANGTIENLKLPGLEGEGSKTAKDAIEDEMQCLVRTIEVRDAKMAEWASGLQTRLTSPNKTQQDAHAGDPVFRTPENLADGSHDTWSETVVCTVTPWGLRRAVERELGQERCAWGGRAVGMLAVQRARRCQAKAISMWRLDAFRDLIARLRAPAAASEEEARQDVFGMLPVAASKTMNGGTVLDKEEFPSQDAAGGYGNNMESGEEGEEVAGAEWRGDEMQSGRHVRPSHDGRVAQVVSVLDESRVRLTEMSHGMSNVEKSRFVEEIDRFVIPSKGERAQASHIFGTCEILI